MTQGSQFGEFLYAHLCLRRVWSGSSAFHDDLKQMVDMCEAADAGDACVCLVDEFVRKFVAIGIAHTA